MAALSHDDIVFGNLIMGVDILGVVILGNIIHAPILPVEEQGAGNKIHGGKGQLLCQRMNQPVFCLEDIVLAAAKYHNFMGRNIGLKDIRIEIVAAVIFLSGVAAETSWQ